MNLEEMKNNMTVIDNLLEKTNNKVEIDRIRIDNAKSKLEKKFSDSSKANLIVCGVFTIVLLKAGHDVNFSLPYRAIIPILTLLGSGWYYYLYKQVKAIDLFKFPPVKLIERLSSLKLKILSGEALTIILLAIIFSLFLPQLITKSALGFWLCVATLALALILSLFFYIPRYKRILNDLTSLKKIE